MRSTLAAALAALAVACGGCQHDVAPPAGRTEATAAADTKATAVFHGDNGDVVVHVEIADDDRERAHGLMNRKEMAQNHGMVFVFPRESVQSFWMKNTLIPLDMIFVDHSFNVVGVVENAEPLTLTDRTIGVPSMYVIEVNGGFARENAIAAGTHVRLTGVF
ncbi:MAG: DUF192 domain-containing protein [Clostridia bacterium]|nr:DUF192 domain-containing protein [Deltaproteobacteria bacterium]